MGQGPSEESDEAYERKTGHKSSQPITTLGTPTGRIGSGSLPPSPSPSSLTDRVMKMVNPSARVLENKQVAQRQETVATAFKWSHGGERLFVTGSFNQWQGKIMMHRNQANPSEFVLVIDIPPGQHEYLFIVDDQWRLNPDDPKIMHNGIENNCLEVKRPVFEQTVGDDSDDDTNERGQPVRYGQVIPSLDVANNPSKAPPHLGHKNVILNRDTPNPLDPTCLDIPGHEILNHACIFESHRSDVMVTAVAQRFRTKPSISVTPKFVTLIYYKPKTEPTIEE